MTPKDLSLAKNPDLRSSLVALRRAADQARKVALQTDTALVVVRGGKLLRIPAAELREQESPSAPTVR